ncbi:hypothetical protein [Aquibacillus sediminis]|uniref:hypothetical protein n=1 Tax=Aquibacillus sediminis TaxID=2574734 RepID=UPI0011088B09|nr:hypothetical protein [Aquibacillus sediminis]
MYPTNDYQYNNYMFGQNDYSFPVEGEDYSYEVVDERQWFPFLPWFPSPGDGQMGPPSSPPPFSPPGQGQQAGAPTSPPPSFVPTQTQQVGTFAVDPGAIRGCLYRFTYVWLNRNQQFWFYPIFVGRNSVSGYRWTGFRWVYYGVDLRQIQSFTCF